MCMLHNQVCRFDVAVNRGNPQQGSFWHAHGPIRDEVHWEPRAWANGYYVASIHRRPKKLLGRLIFCRYGAFSMVLKNQQGGQGRVNLACRKSYGTRHAARILDSSRQMEGGRRDVLVTPSSSSFSSSSKKNTRCISILTTFYLNGQPPSGACTNSKCSVSVTESKFPDPCESGPVAQRTRAARPALTR